MRRLSVILLLAVASAADAQTVDVDLGSVVLKVSDSTTAQVFRIVDQLAEWDRFAHRAYVRWGRTRFNDEDRRLLRQHAELRKTRGRGKGFEQAFLVTDSVEVAAAKAVSAGLLSADEVAAERAILTHFTPKLAPLIDQQRQRIAAFRQELLAERDRLRPLVRQLARFAETKGTMTVPVFLVANPSEESGGGGADGGRLVIEVPSPGSMGILLHEALHVLLVPQAEAIRRAAASGGLSFQALNEAVAYAFAPGLTDDGRQVDLLAEELSRYLIRGTSATDAYAQYYMMAAVIRPLLRASLDHGETISDFLPKAVAKWRLVSPP